MQCKNDIKQYLLLFTHKNGNGYAVVNATDPKVAENVFKAQTRYEDAGITSIKELRWFGQEMQLVEEGSVVTYGLSLYDLAVYNGYKGTLLEFIESMRGPEGPEGPQGPKGDPGDTSQETDPIFSASPAATITEEDIDNWNNSSGGGELSDWDETDTSSLAYIKNKPTIPAAQVQSDWNESDTSSKAYIQNKPTIPASQVNADWNASSGVSQILNKPTIPTILATATQSEINAGVSNRQKTFTPKLMHDNAYIKEASGIPFLGLDPNKFYDFGTVSSALTIPDPLTTSLVSNALNFYALRFIAGADNISITFPTGVIVDDEPTINTGDYVEIMINKYGSNFYASIKVWQAQQLNS